MRTWILSLLVILLAAALAWQSFRPPAEVPVRTSAAPPPIDRAGPEPEPMRPRQVDTAAVLDRGDRFVSMDEQVRGYAAEFFGAATPDEALRPIEALMALGEVDRAMDLKHWLAEACPPASHAIEAMLESQAAVIEEITAYCDGYAMPESEYDEVMGWYRSRLKDTRERLVADMRGMTMAEQSKSILRAVNGAETATDIDAIREALLLSYDTARATDRFSSLSLHELGQDPIMAGHGGDQVQSVALDLLSCIEFVDCGAGSLTTLRRCLFLPVCEAGWTTYDYLHYIQSPMERDQSFLVLERLMEARHSP